MNTIKTKKLHLFLEGKKIKQTSEEKEWEAHEAGFSEGYDAGADDFEEVARRKAKLRAKGIPVMHD
jgi:hypothetical protein